MFNILKRINIRIYYCVCKKLKTSVLTFLVRNKKGEIHCLNLKLCINRIKLRCYYVLNMDNPVDYIDLLNYFFVK